MRSKFCKMENIHLPDVIPFGTLGLPPVGSGIWLYKEHIGLFFLIMSTAFNRSTWRQRQANLCKSKASLVCKFKASLVHIVNPRIVRPYPKKKRVWPSGSQDALLYHVPATCEDPQKMQPLKTQDSKPNTFLFVTKPCLPVVVAHTFNPSTGEAEANGSLSLRPVQSTQ